MSENITYGDNEKISLKVNIVYGLGNMGTMFLTGIFDAACVKFYTDKVFLQPIYIGIAFLLFAIWNALNDPIFGHLSDRTRTKIGRRIPYLRIVSFTFGITFILVWFPPSNVQAQFDIFLYLLITILLFDTCFTIFGLNMIALLPELSLDPNERTKLSLYMTIFGMVAIVVTFLVPFTFLTRTGGKGDFQFICIIIGIVATIFLFLASFTLKERHNFYDQEKSLGFIDNVKYCLKNKSFIFFVIFNFCLTTISANMITVILYYTQYVLNLTGGAVFIPLLIVFIGFLIIYILSPKINKKFGIRKTFIIMGIIGVSGFLLAFIPNIITAVIGISLIAAALAVYGILINPMVADICDEDEIKTGLRREGAYYGINALIIKPAISLGIFIVTFILQYVEYFPQLTEYFGIPQSLGVKIGIQIFSSIIPACILALGIISLYFYPLHGTYYIEIKEKIKEIHSKRNHTL